MSGGTPPFYFGTPEEVIREFVVNVSKKGNVVNAQEIVLSDKPRVKKYAVMWGICNGNTGEHHHYGLKLVTVKKTKDGWGEEKVVSLNDKGDDEIGLLSAFLTDYKARNCGVDSTHYVLERKEFWMLKGKADEQTAVEDLLGDASVFAEIIEKGGDQFFRSIVQTALSSDGINRLASNFLELDAEQLADLNSALGLAQLKKFAEDCRSNLGNSDESFWQDIIRHNPYSLSQLFACPIVLHLEESHLGGMMVNGKGANRVDFLMKNQLTDNAVLVEIKTPLTRLLGPAFRKTYSLSTDTSGSIAQLLKYKHEAYLSHATLMVNSLPSARYEVFNPKTVLIAGSLSEINTGTPDEVVSKRKAFELQRANSKDIQLITFEEMIDKVDILIRSLEGRDAF